MCIAHIVTPIGAPPKLPCCGTPLPWLLVTPDADEGLARDLDRRKTPQFWSKIENIKKIWLLVTERDVLRR
jgi:hypothetical protein